MDDIEAKSRVSALSTDRTVLSHKVDERNPQGERSGYRRNAPAKPPDAPAPIEAEAEEERHLIDIIV